MSVDCVPRNRAALFIDGPNFFSTVKALGFDVDYGQLLAEFEKCYHSVRPLYYTTITDDQEYSSIKQLLDWLGYNGYVVVTKPAKEFADSSGRRKINGNITLEIAVDAFQLAKHLEEVVRSRATATFVCWWESIQRRGVRASFVSTISTAPAIM